METRLHRYKPLQPYLPIWQDMQSFSKAREPETPDQIWLLEHEPVYTQGRAGKAEHVLNPKSIPIIQTDRGGQVTYHGPGQLMIYTLLDIDRLGLNAHTLVQMEETWILDLLNQLKIKGHRLDKAPGIYVNQQKIASIGLRISNGRCYHGIALNVAMDLSPFKGINPCGFKTLTMTQLQNYIADISIDEVCDIITQNLSKGLKHAHS